MTRSGRWASQLLVFAVLATGSVASARGKSKEDVSPPAPEKPPLTLSLSLKEAGPDEPWELSVKNASSEPIALLSDARLVWFEVAQPGGKKPHVCRISERDLPADSSAGQKKELKPGESATRTLDPRFYCFNPGNQDVLVPTAQVTPHYGFPSKTKARWSRGKRVEEKLPDTAPFVARPASNDSTLGPAKNVEGDPVVLDARYAVWSTEPEEPKDEPVLQVVRGSDAETERSVTATIRLKNPTEHKLRLYFRRALLSFKVLSLKGAAECPADPDSRNPDRGAFTSVPSGGSITVTSRVVEMCPRGTFAESGLYLVSAELAAPNDGGDFGFDAFTGTLKSSRPAPVRVRRTLHLEYNRPTTRGPSGAPVPGMPPGTPPPPGMPPGMPIQPFPAAPAPPPPADSPPPPPPPPGQ